LKRCGLSWTLPRRLVFPRLFSRGSIEAVKLPEKIRHSSAFPRLFSRGSIEALHDAAQPKAVSLFPRLFSRGSIEAPT